MTDRGPWLLKEVLESCQAIRAEGPDTQGLRAVILATVKDQGF
jgi:hypothetical protein